VSPSTLTCRCKYGTTPLATSKLHTVYHNKKLIFHMFKISANEMGSGSEPPTVFMQILTHTVIRNTHKTILIYKKCSICLKSLFRLLVLGDLQFLLVPLILFTELGKLWGYESRSGNLYYVHYWCASDRLVWNSADTTRKKYILSFLEHCLHNV